MISYLNPASYFIFKQHFEDGRVFCGASTGHGLFISCELAYYAYLESEAAFVVSKRGDKYKVLIKSWNLISDLKNIGIIDEFLPDYTFDFRDLVGHYDTLYQNLSGQSHLRLLILDFLSDHAAFDGLDLEKLGWNGILSSHHWQVIQARKRARDFDGSDQTPLLPRLQECLKNFHGAGWVRKTGTRDRAFEEKKKKIFRARLKITMRSEVSKSFSQLQGQTANDSMGSLWYTNQLSRLKIPPDKKNAWKIGFDRLRQISRGRLPQSVDEVIHCILIGNAVRKQVGSSNLDEFLRDLDHWRDHVVRLNLEDVTLYDQVVKVLWKKHRSITDPCPKEKANMHHFQELFQNLLSQMEIDVFTTDWDDLTPPSVNDGRHAESSPPAPKPTQNPRARAKSSGSTETSFLYKRRWKPHKREVVILASTVIFVAMVAAFLLLFHTSACQQAKEILAKEPHLPEPSRSITLKRNCIFLACYLGLSTRTIEKIPFDDDSWNRVPCHECGIRVQNVGIHYKRMHSNPDENPECSNGFGYEKSRKYNTLNHEENYCPQRAMQAGTRHCHGESASDRLNAGTGWLETSQPATLSNSDPNQDSSATSQPTYKSTSCPIPYRAYSNITEAFAAVASAAPLSSDGLAPLRQGFLVSQLDIQSSPEDQLLLEQHTFENGCLLRVPTTTANPTAPVALDGGGLDALLDQPLNSSELETWTAQNGLVDVDMDMGMEEIPSLSDQPGFSWIEPVAEDLLIFPAQVMSMEGVTFDLDAFEPSDRFLGLN